jgi:WD40 repeat protein
MTSSSMNRAFQHLRDVVLPDGKRFLSVTGGDGPMRLWDLESGKLIRAYIGHDTTSLALTKDGRRAFCSTYGGTVFLYDVESGEDLQHFTGHRNWVWCVNLSPDGKTLITLRLWKMPL